MTMKSVGVIVSNEDGYEILFRLFKKGLGSALLQETFHKTNRRKPWTTMCRVLAHKIPVK